jgi:hypothetical protein
MFIIHLLAATAVFWAALLHPEEAESATTGSISYAHGDGYTSGDPTRNITRFDVLNVNALGMIYGRADVLSSDDSNSSLATRIIGHYNLGWHGAAQMQNQARISQTSIGIGYSYLGPKSSWFVDAYKVSSNYYGDSYNLFGYGSYKFTNSTKAEGFIEYLLPESGKFGAVVFTQPSIMFMLHEGLWAGIEQQRYFNKNGINGLDEVVNQVKIKWEF